MTITKLIEKALHYIGSIINQSPTKDEMKRLKTPPLFKSTFPKKKLRTFDMKNQHDNRRDHKAKGSIQTDSQIFNKPRGTF